LRFGQPSILIGVQVAGEIFADRQRIALQSSF
jgi:hypothetical protein